VTCAMLGGAATGVAVSQFTLPTAAVLLGWDVSVVIFVGSAWSAVWRLDPGGTARLAKREDPSSA
jgi:hypothetical protein